MMSFMMLMMHARDDMGAWEVCVIGLLRVFESPAVSALVSKHFVTIFSKICNNIL